MAWIHKGFIESSIILFLADIFSRLLFIFMVTLSQGQNLCGGGDIWSIFLGYSISMIMSQGSLVKKQIQVGAN